MIHVTNELRKRGTLDVSRGLARDLQRPTSKRPQILASEYMFIALIWIITAVVLFR